MITAVYYFTGTGNSLAAAKKIAAGLGDCELLPIVREYEERRFRTDADRILFLFPLYYLSFPKIVLDFLQAFEFRENSEIICIVTRGFRPMGGVLAHFRKLLKVKNRKLSAGFYIDMPSNDVILFNTHTPENQKKLLEEAEERIREIVDAIRNGRKSFDPEPFGFMRPLRHGPAYLRHLETAWKEFHTEGSCTGCKICANVCPLENITMKDRRPVWSNHCQLCEACINYCPQKAIQFGKNSLHKDRYVHPDVPFREIAAQRSDE